MVPAYTWNVTYAYRSERQRAHVSLIK